MKGTTKIKDLGAINLNEISFENGQIETHMLIDDVSEELENVMDACADDYMKKHVNVKSDNELNYDIRIVFSYGSFAYDNRNNEKFSLFIIVWQKSDDITGKDTAEFYEEIPITFNSADAKKIKRIIWNSLGKALFDL